jgi:hypothetical protein
VRSSGCTNLRLHDRGRRLHGWFTAPRSLTAGTGWGDCRSVLEAPDRHPLPGRQPLRRPPDHRWAGGLGRPSSTAPTAWSPTRRRAAAVAGSGRRPRPQPRNWMVLSVPANTAHYDDRAILSGHGPSLRWALVPQPRGDEHRPVETHSDPRVHHHPDRHGARLGRPAGRRSTFQRVRRPSRAARADRRRPCRPPARGPRPRR